MRKLVIAAAAVAAFAFAASSQAAFKDFTVNGQTVSVKTQELLAKQVLASAGTPGAKISPQVEEQVRGMLVQMAALSQYARDKKLDQNPDVKVELAFNEEMALMRAAVDHFIAQHPVTEEELRSEYNSEKEHWGKNEFRVQHILVGSEKEAADLIAQLRKGGDFAKLAQAKSIDEATKADGGQLDWNSASAFPGEFAAAIKNAKKGELIAKPVKTDYGWHVVKVTDTRPAQLFPSYEERKPGMKDALGKAKAADFVRMLTSQAVIK